MARLRVLTKEVLFEINSICISLVARCVHNNSEVNVSDRPGLPTVNNARFPKHGRKQLRTVSHVSQSIVSSRDLSGLVMNRADTDYCTTLLCRPIAHLSASDLKASPLETPACTSITQAAVKLEIFRFASSLVPPVGNKENGNFN